MGAGFLVGLGLSETNFTIVFNDMVGALLFGYWGVRYRRSGLRIAIYPARAAARGGVGMRHSRRARLPAEIKEAGRDRGNDFFQIDQCQWSQTTECSGNESREHRPTIISQIKIVLDEVTSAIPAAATRENTGGHISERNVRR